jgi:hypothetical protein
MNNTNATVIQNIINKLPPTIFFESLPDRKQALKYLQWLNTNVSEAKSFNNQDQFLREIIAKELRIVSMKIIEIEILLMVGLNNITIDDFSIDSKTLIKKLMSENPDKYDLDIMYRILAQIMTKLPRDLKERVTGKQKLEIFQKLTQYSNIDNALIEKFIAFDPTINTPVSMELDSGDYNTLNKQYLNELDKYEEAKGYLDNNSIEFATIATNMSLPIPPKNNNIDARYIDNNPDFMLGQNDNTLYYYDSSSGTISEIPIKEKQTPVSLKDLKVVLTSNKVKKGDIQNLINGYTPTVETVVPNTIEPSITEPAGFFSSIGSYFTSSRSTVATATTSASSTISPMPAPQQTEQPPQPPQYIKDLATNNTKSVESFISNIDSMDKIGGSNSIEEDQFLKKIKNENKNIENVALGFVALIILVFLLVIFNSIRNNSGKSK